ncbi:hypothetical protein SAMN05421767_1612 [Granulicatella balaenopterae]|uniref:Uncharacterized protein n=1 Tax=Granulicatella balaenopterae TaxID=137733 RepID=A0A1H9PL23_9LACT|nr:hypothetical protein [Granulicatella balaenopterae]SER48509.1 hypothetical protein SAMN05421767_1612 [Granulicatella balaenopterae]
MHIKEYMYDLKETIEEMPKKKKAMIIGSVFGLCLIGGGIAYVLTQQPEPTAKVAVVTEKTEDEKNAETLQQLTDKVALVTKESSEKEITTLKEEIDSSTLKDEEKKNLLDTLEKNYQPSEEVAVVEEAEEESSETTTEEPETVEVEAPQEQSVEVATNSNTQTQEYQSQQTVEVASNSNQQAQPEYKPEPKPQPEPQPETQPQPEPEPQPEDDGEVYPLLEIVGKENAIGNSGKWFSTCEEGMAYIKQVCSDWESEYVGGRCYSVPWSDGTETWTVELYTE